MAHTANLSQTALGLSVAQIRSPRNFLTWQWHYLRAALSGNASLIATFSTFVILFVKCYLLIITQRIYRHGLIKCTAVNRSKLFCRRSNSVQSD